MVHFPPSFFVLRGQRLEIESWHKSSSFRVRELPRRETLGCAFPALARKFAKSCLALKQSKGRNFDTNFGR